MANLTNPIALWMKGLLFVVLGIFASAILVSRHPDIATILLLLISVWAFCRAYYFAFYVVQHYVDPTFRFAGLVDFARYALLGKTPDRSNTGDTIVPNEIYRGSESKLDDDVPDRTDS